MTGYCRVTQGYARGVTDTSMPVVPIARKCLFLPRENPMPCFKNGGVIRGISKVIRSIIRSTRRVPGPQWRPGQVLGVNERRMFLMP